MEPIRQWGARRGETLLQVIGPDAEAMCRAVGGLVAYRDSERPTADNGYSLWGPWVAAPDTASLPKRQTED